LIGTWSLLHLERVDNVDARQQLSQPWLQNAGHDLMSTIHRGKIANARQELPTVAVAEAILEIPFPFRIDDR
jgi:hypothetical protein